MVKQNDFTVEVDRVALLGVAELLEHAVSKEEPYIIEEVGIEEVGVEKEVSREEFLEFFLENASESIYTLAGCYVDESIAITELDDGGCEVIFDGEIIYFTKEEVEVMKNDYRVALRRVLLKR